LTKLYSKITAYLDS